MYMYIIIISLLSLFFGTLFAIDIVSLVRGLLRSRSFLFIGKHVIITGGSKGLGKVIEISSVVNVHIYDTFIHRI